MKKSLVTLVLAFALAATAQQATPPAGGQSAQSGQATGPTIKDPAEYNAYVTALQQTDPSAKSQALEAFLQQYPSSVVRVSALELLMGAYQQSNNPQKMADAAQRLLQADPGNLRALALLTFTNRMCAAQAGPTAVNCLNDAGKYGQQGMQALQSAQPPAGVSPEDFAKLKQQTTPIFAGAVGMAALQAKNYPQAEEALGQAVAANPADLQNVYPLALAYLSQTPMDPKGLFWIARAVTLSNNNAQVAAFGKSKYTKYHGGDDGWQELVQQAATQTTIPPNFQIAPAPTPAEQAAKLADTKPVAQMTFDEFQMIFTSGNQAAADKVWNQIKGKPIAFEGKVIEAGKDNLKLAATYDDIQNNVADVEITFPVNIPASLAPKVGEMSQVQGSPVSYDANPFMIHMDQGAFVGKKAAAAAAGTKGKSSAAKSKAKTTTRKKK
jgi:tetratricopeptide (TPR) repeat protein